MFCKALIICIFACTCFIDCCLMASVSRYNRKMERQSETCVNQGHVQNREDK